MARLIPEIYSIYWFICLIELINELVKEQS